MKKVLSALFICFFGTVFGVDLTIKNCTRTKFRITLDHEYVIAHNYNGLLNKEFGFDLNLPRAADEYETLAPHPRINKANPRVGIKTLVLPGMPLHIKTSINLAGKPWVNTAAIDTRYPRSEICITENDIIVTPRVKLVSLDMNISDSVAVVFINNVNTVVVNELEVPSQRQAPLFLSPDDEIKVLLLAHNEFKMFRALSNRKQIKLFAERFSTITVRELAQNAGLAPYELEGRTLKITKDSANKVAITVL